MFSVYTSPLILVIGKHKEIKFYFYADESKVYVYLSPTNPSAAFEELNKCLDDVKEWMSTSKTKWNPDKTEFIIFGSKGQRDKLKSCFPIQNLGSQEPVENFGIWASGSILIFPSANLFRMSAKVVLCNSMTLDMSGGFFLIILLYLWPMLLFVVRFITATHFSGVSLSSICINYSKSKIVQLELYQTPLDTPV